MILFEIASSTDIPLPEGMEYFVPFSFHPDLIKSATGKLYKSMQFRHNNKIYTYIVMNDAEIQIEPIPYDPHYDTEKYHNTVHVKIKNHNLLVAPFDNEINEPLYNDNDSIVVKKVKEIEPTVNVASFTDEEFLDEFNRPKMDYERGSVTGYLILSAAQLESNRRKSNASGSSKSRQKTSDDQTSDGTSSADKQSVSFFSKNPNDDSGKDSKLQRAIKMFKNNQTVPRKILIDRFVSQLGLSQSVASTYYTHAKHIVTDPDAKGKVAYWDK